MRFFGASSRGLDIPGGKLRGFFEAGWRPLLGWICTGAIALAFLYVPALNSWLVPHGKPAAPTPDLVQTLALLTCVLTTAGLRTLEKLQGVATPTTSAPTTVIEVNNAGAVIPQPVAG